MPGTHRVQPLVVGDPVNGSATQGPLCGLAQDWESTVDYGTSCRWKKKWFKSHLIRSKRVECSGSLWQRGFRAAAVCDLCQGRTKPRHSSGPTPGGWRSDERENKREAPCGWLRADYRRSWCTQSVRASHLPLPPLVWQSTHVSGSRTTPLARSQTPQGKTRHRPCQFVTSDSKHTTPAQALWADSTMTTLKIKGQEEGQWVEVLQGFSLRIRPSLNPRFALKRFYCFSLSLSPLRCQALLRVGQRQCTPPPPPSTSAADLGPPTNSNQRGGRTYRRVVKKKESFVAKNQHVEDLRELVRPSTASSTPPGHTLNERNQSINPAINPTIKIACNKREDAVQLSQ